MTEDTASNLFGILCLIAGVFVLILGCFGLIKNRSRGKNWRSAKGIIVGPIDLSDTFRDDAENPRYPVIEFVDHSGHVHSFTFDWNMSGLPGLGSEVDVLYDPDIRKRRYITSAQRRISFRLA